MSDFHPFSAAHALTVLVCVAVGAAIITLGTRWKHSPKERAVAHAFAGFALGVNLWSVVFWALPAQWDIRESLPIQLCDLASLLVPAALLTDRRILRSLVFYWGLGLSTQAFITPTVRTGVDSEHFWLFWLVHFVIVGGALYDFIVRGYRPTWADFRKVVAISIAYVAVVVTLNIRLDANYGYVGNTLPQNRTIVDALGPWPWRIGVMGAIVIPVLAVLTLLGRGRRKESA